MPKLSDIQQEERRARILDAAERCFARAGLEGIYAEASSVVPLVAAQKLLRRGDIDRDTRVVAVSTSSGLKDPEVTQLYLRDIPLTEPTPEGLARTLKETYGYTLAGVADA